MRKSALGKFGLLGEHLSHSLSPALHAMVAGYEYKLYEVAPRDLETFLRTTDLDGMNVTVPYKKAVVPYCATLSERAKKAGCVNTLIRRDTGWHGDNTDISGAKFLLLRLGISVRNRKTLIFGDGGAAGAFRVALSELGAEQVYTVSRRGAITYADLDSHRDAEILINATPVGMYPEFGGIPCDPAAFPNAIAAADAVYNPLRTEFLQKAEQAGLATENGLSMLVMQGILSAGLFAGIVLSRPHIEVILSAMQKQIENIVLIGMPGCGKSAVGRELAKITGKLFFDTDEEFEKSYGISPADYITTKGEAAFRLRETDILNGLSGKTGCIIATGGGCVTREENDSLLRRNGRIIWLTRDLTCLPTVSRPLSQKADVYAIWREREPLYRRFADDTVENTDPVEAARRILGKGAAK